mmetsp:Transcript_9802/g.20773  ORF Transcript_9802/g.20773 Transcript_9802/m.20773 type:complete len:280 (+) Transcript_9802:1207-2046(+)
MGDLAGPVLVVPVEARLYLLHLGGQKAFALAIHSEELPELAEVEVLTIEDTDLSRRLPHSIHLRHVAESLQHTWELFPGDGPIAVNVGPRHYAVDDFYLLLANLPHADEELSQIHGAAAVGVNLLHDCQCLISVEVVPQPHQDALELQRIHLTRAIAVKLLEQRREVRVFTEREALARAEQVHKQLKLLEVQGARAVLIDLPEDFLEHMLHRLDAAALEKELQLAYLHGAGAVFVALLEGFAIGLALLLDVDLNEVDPLILAEGDVMLRDGVEGVTHNC